MSVQRRYGRLAQRVTLYPTITETNRRGDKIHMPDLANPIEIRAAVVPVRSSRGEVKGQVEVATYTLICDADLRALGLDTWSRVRWRGVDHDVSAPPLYRHGATRHVRHWSAEIRARPRETGSG